MFVLFLEAVELLYGSRKPFGSSVLGTFWRATRASRLANPRPSGLVSLDFAESHESYVRGVALIREPPKLDQAQPLLAKLHRCRALLPAYDTRS